MANVDTNATDAIRVSMMWQLVSDVVEDMQSQSPADVNLNIKKFLLHVAWHEGRFLRTRVQDPRHPGGPPGPGRSFFQFEPPRAKDAVDYAKQKEPDKHWLTLLATRSGQTNYALETASTELHLATDWPANNLIERLLRENDLFGVYMTRIVLARLPSAIPVGNAGHAQYWADHWKIGFTPPEDRNELTTRFTNEANAVDQLIPH
jgi:hypothetical protein